MPTRVSICCIPRFSAVSKVFIWGRGAGNSILSLLDLSVLLTVPVISEDFYIKGTCYTCCALHSFFANSWEPTHNKISSKVIVKAFIDLIFPVTNKVTLFYVRKLPPEKSARPPCNRTCKTIVKWYFKNISMPGIK